MSYIIIDSIGSVSALGGTETTILHSLEEKKCRYKTISLNKKEYPIIPLHVEAENELKELLQQYPKYKKSDRTAQLAILASSKCLSKVKFLENTEWVINAGSSRGATGLWENFHTEFIKHHTVPLKSSPLTTLGNISTHVAQHQKLLGFQIDHSITCSSGLQALANAYAWLRSGLANHFLAIGTEAPLTDFTIAQMVALGIYSTEIDEFPCKPCQFIIQTPLKTKNWPKGRADETEKGEFTLVNELFEVEVQRRNLKFSEESRNKANTFVLGEAAVSIALVNKNQPSIGEVYLAGIGTGSETIPSPTAISPYGDAFRLSMSKAIESAGLQPEEINMIIPHSPGTYQGDFAEYNAIRYIPGL